MNGFDCHKDQHSIATITMDMSGLVNAMNDEYYRVMANNIEKLETETDLTGGDLNELLNESAGRALDITEFMQTTNHDYLLFLRKTG